MFISEKYLDMAKKWRVRITLDDGSSVFLKFQDEPKDDDVFMEANKYVASVKAGEVKTVEENNLKTINEEKMQLVKDVSIASLKTKLGVKDGVTK